MPTERGTFREPDLVELRELDPTIHLNILYAGSSNFLGRALYRDARAMLQRPAAEALVRANAVLRLEGYGLLVTDAYRPWRVTKEMWDSVSKEEREAGFVANPKTGSKHNRGCAVDVTLYLLETGDEVEMPSMVDEFSERAHVDYPGGSEEAAAKRELLRRVMEAEGFAVYENEWWHFDYKDWREYRVMDVEF
ncbi:MAG: hypothetical protein RI897_3179 [Verrucomicrobiota bacterium]